ncbi:hypothetical protein M422DRAFT_239666 [Sphaerobolus stellatus SS14]|nr:hypothetical protein M422DRAFT_239666 [Sphaerobolus stellatus SS14]
MEQGLSPNFDLQTVSASNPRRHRQSPDWLAPPSSHAQLWDNRRKASPSSNTSPLTDHPASQIPMPTSSTSYLTSGIPHLQGHATHCRLHLLAMGLLHSQVCIERVSSRLRSGSLVMQLLEYPLGIPLITSSCES